MARPSADEKKTRLLVCELLALFYHKGWVSGTGGGIAATFREGHTLMAPTGVHKERVLPEDLFVANSKTGEVIAPAQNEALGLTECAPIFCQIMNQRGAGAVMHSHALSAVLAADIARGKDYLLLESLEMLKGVMETSRSRHYVPIINNTLHERELVRSVQTHLEMPRFARAFCILVRDHGVYIWGRDIWEAKRHVEVYHFLFEAIVARRQLGIRKGEEW